ncbi:hypothetical protein N8657_00605 [bacterium]|nr:hypothetical protein [bacterium]
MKLSFKFGKFKSANNSSLRLLNLSTGKNIYEKALIRPNRTIVRISSKKLLQDQNKTIKLRLTIIDKNGLEPNLEHKGKFFTFKEDQQSFKLSISRKKLEGNLSFKLKPGFVKSKPSPTNIDSNVSPVPITEISPEPIPEDTAAIDQWLEKSTNPDFLIYKSTNLERPTSQATDIYLDSLNGPLKRYGKDRYDQSLRLEELGKNNPNLNPLHYYFFDQSISQEWGDQLTEWYGILFRELGGYDKFVHVLYDINQDSHSAVLKGLDSLGFFYDNNGAKVEPDINFVYANRSCLSGFPSNFKWDTAEEHWGFCNQPNPFTDPYWEYDRDIHLGELAFKYSVLNGVAHEYYHHVQNAHDLAAGIIFGNNNDLVKAPSWYVEGTAQIIPMWLLRDNFEELSLSKQYGLTYEQAVLDSQLSNALGSGAGSPNNSYIEMKMALLGKADSNNKCDYVDSREELHDTSVGCDWHIMTSYLMHITSPQVALVDIMEDQWMLGFEGSFAKHVGLTLNEFYEEFNNFMKGGSIDDDPPDHFFVGPNPLSDTVNFWDIDSGIISNNQSKNKHQKLFSISGQVDEKKVLTTPFDLIINSEAATKLTGTKGTDHFSIETGLGYKLIKKFNPYDDQIFFCGCPYTQLATYHGDTYISNGNDLEAIVRGVDASDLIFEGDIIKGI